MGGLNPKRSSVEKEEGKEAVAELIYLMQMALVRIKVNGRPKCCLSWEIQVVERKLFSVFVRTFLTVK